MQWLLAVLLVGDIGPRSAENDALNNTLGFIVTGNSVILTGSGDDCALGYR
jgi:hypothetical protein